MPEDFFVKKHFAVKGRMSLFDFYTFGLKLFELLIMLIPSLEVTLVDLVNFHEDLIQVKILGFIYRQKIRHSLHS
jgi:hypothetical protein